MYNADAQHTLKGRRSWFKWQRNFYVKFFLSCLKNNFTEPQVRRVARLSPQVLGI